MDELELWVEIKRCGDIGKDFSCYSNFIIGIMYKLGNSTQITYHSIMMVGEDIIYLVMDNAGVNGTN